MLTTKCACSECCALLTGASVLTGQGSRRCDFCGAPSSAGPLTTDQCHAVIDGSRGKRVVAGGDGVLREHQDNLVQGHRIGKYVHVLEVADVGGPDDGEPWFTCRVVGEKLGRGSIYPAYPRSAIDPDTRQAEARADRTRTENLFIDALRARLNQGAKDYGERSFSRSLPELLGELEQELLDQAGWAFVGWCKIQRMKAALAEAEQAIG